MSKVTKATFDSTLKAAVKSDNSLADSIQALVMFGFEHYKASGDGCYFERIMNAPFRASRREAVRAYVVAHSNLKCTKHPTEEGVLIFKVDPKSPNKTRIVKIAVDKETGKAHTWYSFSKEAIQVAFDIDARIKALIGQARAAIEGKDGKKLKGTKKHAQEVLQSLETLAA